MSRMRLLATRPMSPIRIIPMKSRQGIGCTCGRRPGIRLRLQVVDMVPRDQEPEGTLSSTANHRPGPHPTVENQIRETLAPPPWYPRTLATDQPILLPLDTSNGSLTITKYGIKNFGCAGSRMYSPLEGLRVRVPVPMREKGVVWCAHACMP